MNAFNSFAAAALVCLVIVRAGAGVASNEIFYNAPEDINGLEWVELHKDSDETQRILSRIAALQFPDHSPNAICFPPLDQLRGRRSFKCGVGSFQPSANCGGFDLFAECLEQPS